MLFPSVRYTVSARAPAAMTTHAKATTAATQILRMPLSSSLPTEALAPHAAPSEAKSFTAEGGETAKDNPTSPNPTNMIVQNLRTLSRISALRTWKYQGVLCVLCVPCGRIKHQGRGS